MHSAKGGAGLLASGVACCRYAAFSRLRRTVRGIRRVGARCVAVFMTLATEASSFRPWHLFVLSALVASTIAILVARPADPVGAILLSLAIGAASLVGLATYRAIKPLTQKEFQETTVMVGARSRAAVEREKTLVLRSIKELEFDRAMGKVSDKDFEEMGRRLRLLAIRLMKQLDVDAVDYMALIERELQGRLGASAETFKAPAEVEKSVCLSCRTVNDDGANFCKGCGKPLKQAAEEGAQVFPSSLGERPGGGEGQGHSRS